VTCRSGILRAGSHLSLFGGTPGRTPGELHSRYEPGGGTRRARVVSGGFPVPLAGAGVPAFELAWIMGTSVQMIERHYGTLLDGAGAGIASRLDALDAERGAATPQ
jgi:hypothetical protein